LSSIRSPSGPPRSSQVWLKVPEPVRVGVHAALPAAAGDQLVDPGGGQRVPVARAEPQLGPPRLSVPGPGAQVPVQAPGGLVGRS
jgi:hypothetical protein